jgi:hypothetical protein
MTPIRRIDEGNRTIDRPRHWLTVLERELKSRIGWVDEAISPFAGRRRAPVPTPAPVSVQVQAQRSTIPTGKAA